MVSVRLTPEAHKQFHALPRGIRPRVARLIGRLRNWPNVSGAKALSGELSGRYRLRTGAYRVQFTALNLGDFCIAVV